MGIDIVRGRRNVRAEDFDEEDENSSDVVDGGL